MKCIYSLLHFILKTFELKIIIPLLFCCTFFTSASGQTQRIVSTYLSAQFNQTLHDYTIGNNPWSLGLGLQAYLNTHSSFKPTVEITGDLYLESDKVLRSNPDGSFPENGNDVGGMINLFAGSSFHPANSFYFSFVAGPSFINKQTFLGIKPSFGFSFSKTQRIMGKISYINIFNRTKMTNEDFGSLSFAICFKLF